MSVDIFYRHKTGRLFLKMLERSGGLRAAAKFLHTGASKLLIGPYIRQNKIDMTEFKGQEYRSFAEFFGRKKEMGTCRAKAYDLISPCDSLLSIYTINSDLVISIKGSRYCISDLIPKKNIADHFADGLCLVFRLQASDYHHFCYFDDGVRHRTHYIPGELHSVQPIAVRTVPVYRLNRRWWTVFDTRHFGRAAQIEVGALLVGGVSYRQDTGVVRKGDEMGNFELCGSTIIVLLSASARHSLKLRTSIGRNIDRGSEIRVTYGEVLGSKKV